MTSAPKGESKSAAQNTPASAGEGEALPQVPNPGDPVPAGKAQVVKPATEKQTPDPGGQTAATKKTGRRTTAKKKADPIRDLDDLSKLPISVGVGQVIVAVHEKVGAPVLQISLKGWLGEPEFQIRTSDIEELEDALAQLRKELS